MTQPPRLSVVIPAYDSHATLPDCLTSLQGQTFDGFEVIVVDSGPSEEGARIVADQFPWVRFERSVQRLFPHAARNRGAAFALADLLVFTDPDVYPASDWLARLYETHVRSGGVVVGAVRCFGRRWVDRGAHLAKFDMLLPGGATRPVSIAPTVSMLISKRLLEDLGWFPGEVMVGDTVFSWRVRDAGVSITFDPTATVTHHHVASWAGLLRERLSRGNEFARMRSRAESWDQGRRILQLVASLIPLRWFHFVYRTFRASVAAGLAWDFFLTLPIVLSAHAAWLLGESRGLFDAITKNAHD